jgi:hypothetical protein
MQIIQIYQKEKFTNLFIIQIRLPTGILSQPDAKDSAGSTTYSCSSKKGQKQMLIRILIAGALGLALTACGTAPTRIAFEPAVKQKLVEVKVLSALPQDEIIVRAEAFGATAAMGGGLIGAFIDSKVAESRQNTIQDSMDPFYAAVDDFDFRARFERALAAELGGNQAIKFAAIENLSQFPLPAEVDARRAALSTGSGLMQMHTSYTFTGDFRRLILTTRVELKLRGEDKPAFSNYFFYQSNPVGNGGAESIRAWAQNNGERYRMTAEEAVQQMMQMLKIDLAASAADSASAQKASLTMEGQAKVPVTITGPVLASQSGRTILRHTDGRMYSLPQ